MLQIVIRGSLVSEIWLIGIVSPNFEASVLFRGLVERLISGDICSSVALIWIRLAAGFFGDGVFRLESESDDNEIEVSHSN